MKIYALIPARGGSTRIKNKNIQKIKNVPLVNWTLYDAFNSSYIDKVFLSTNCNDIKKESLKLDMKNEKFEKYYLINRPDELCTSQSSTEEAIQHFLETLDKCEIERPDFIVLLQCTTPFRSNLQIDHAIEYMYNENADSLFFGYPLGRWIWDNDNKPINYDYKNRIMTQDKKWEIVEGGDYIFKTKLFEETGLRLGGKIVHYLISSKIYNFDIDHYEDLEICRAIANKFDLKAKE